MCRVRSTHSKASRTGALAQFSLLELRTGSTLIDQFETSYIPRVFATTMPWCVGGPDFKNTQRTRPRRFYEYAPFLSLSEYNAMISCRCEAQLRLDWKLVPGLGSLDFASNVNLGVSMSIKRAVRRTAADSLKDEEIGKATANIYKLLWDGE